MRWFIQLGGIATVVATVATSGCEPVGKGLEEAIGEQCYRTIIIGELGGPMLTSLVGVSSPLGNPSPLNLLAVDAGWRAVGAEGQTEKYRFPSILDSK